MKPLNTYLTEYKEYNTAGTYKPVAIGKFGIRTRESIYKKELANDYSKNKIIFKNTLTVGMGSSQIDIGILTEDVLYSVSPAYHTYKISGAINSDYLGYCLKQKNYEMFNLYMKRGSRQGKSIDLVRWLTYCIPVYSIENQLYIVQILSGIEAIINKKLQILEKLDVLIKARFVEMFGDLRTNPFGFKKKKLKDTCIVITGNTPSRSVPEYYGDYMEWIKTDNIVTGFLNPTKSVEYLSEAGVNVGRTVEKDSILMSCIAGSVASIGRVCITNRKVAFNQQINAVIPKEYDVLFLYVMLQMSKDYLTEEINMALKGILSKSKLEEKEFVIPPIKQQKQFATFVTQVDKSKVAVQKSLEQTQMLFDSLLQQYFG